MQLGNRLQTIADTVEKCNVLADIGTDHGYIPIYCIQNKICHKAIACDINSGPLLAAERNIAENSLSDLIQTRLSNGLEALAPNEADTIVIAGMGGFLIRDILISGKSKISENTRLVLQPMVAVPELREFLCSDGFCITEEKLAREGNKFYNILSVKKGDCVLSEKELLIGKIPENAPHYGDYITFHQNVFKKIISGLEKSTGNQAEKAKYKKMLDIISK